MPFHEIRGECLFLIGAVVLALPFVACQGLEESIADAAQEDNPADEAPTVSENTENTDEQTFGEDPWPWCPDAASTLGGEWKGRLQVTAEAIYCSSCACGLGLSQPTKDLETTFNAKAQIRFIAGEYPIPSEAGEYEFRLPVCVKFREENQQPLLADAGTLSLQVSSSGGNLKIAQPLKTSSGQTWCLLLESQPSLDVLKQFLVLDGDYYCPRIGNEQPKRWVISLLQGDCDSWEGSRFDSCVCRRIEDTIYQIFFTGGWVELHERIGTVEAGGYGIFTRAAGELNSSAFEQKSFWNLALSSSLHFLSQHFMFLFDSPAGEACGIKIENLDVSKPAPTVGRLVLIRCDHSEIEERAVTQVTRL